MDDQTIIKHILGIKVRELRTAANMSFQNLSDKSGLSVSYLNEIEKGKKYPKGEKLLQLAQALGTQYDHLVSLQLPPVFDPIIEILRSPLLSELPLEMFGLDIQKVITLFVESPQKVTAFLKALLEIGRSYEMKNEQIYLAALRAFQEMNENYFEPYERSADLIRDKMLGTKKAIPELVDLEKYLHEAHNIRVDYHSLSTIDALSDIRSVYNKMNRLFYINQGLNVGQKRFLVAKEIALQTYQQNNRHYETPPTGESNFDQLLDNFKASYIAAALLMPESDMITDVESFISLETWHPENLNKLLEKYQCTPEMLMQRLTNILPHYFDIKNLFFLRFVANEKSNERILTKELHFNKRHAPYSNGLSEHYCRRWISVSQFPLIENVGMAGKTVISGGQLSHYIDTDKEYFCMSMAFANVSNDYEKISVTIGFLADENNRRRVLFLNDPQLTKKEVHTTCERCRLENCKERVVPAIKLIAEIRSASRIKALNNFLSQ